MKLNKMMMIGVGLITCLSALSAQTRLNVTGATAFRSATIKAIADSYTPGTFKAIYVGSGAASLSGAQGSNFAAFRGTLGSLGDTIIKVSFSGSAAGVIAVKDQADVNVINDATLNAAALGYNTTVAANVNAPEKMQLALSDVEQPVAYPDSDPLDGGPVSVIPFQFAVSAVAPAALTNIDSNKVQANWTSGFPAGTQPAVLYTGAPADLSKIVYAVGRDISSGTRLTFVTETGIGLSSPLNQYNIAATPAFIGDGGYTSGSTMADALKSANAQLNTYIGYMGIGDARRAANLDGTGVPIGGAAARLLTYNGQAFSINNVEQGNYSFWNYEYLYNSALTPSQADVATEINTQISNQPTDANGRWINLNDMLAGRNGSGFPVVR